MIKSAVYYKSFVDAPSCPRDGKSVFAFVGRSNVGKSSLINGLVQQKNLAKTSSTPGKTKMMNYFLINEHFYFVDLPGYGFAKVARAERTGWTERLFAFINHHTELKQLFVLIDSSIPPQVIDLEFIHQLGKRQTPFTLIFTKSDKESQSITHQHIHLFKQKLQNTWEELPYSLIVSSKKKEGFRTLHDFIFSLL